MKTCIKRLETVNRTINTQQAVSRLDEQTELSHIDVRHKEQFLLIVANESFY